MTNPPKADTEALHLDFETASELDLKKVGAMRYATHPSTRVVCVAHTNPWDEKSPGSVNVSYIPPGGRWHPDPRLTEWIKAGKPIRAWNAMFEYLILQHTWSCFYVPGVELSQVHDTMAEAAYWGLPLSLDTAAEALPHLKIQKDKAGHALMKRMSRPRGTLADGSPSWWDDTDPAKRAQLMDYCAQDVRVERAISQDIPGLPDRERQIWLLDAKANIRGVPLDVDLAQKMKAIAVGEQARLNDELKDLTGGDVTSTTQNKALVDWCVKQGLQEADGGLAKDRLPGLIDKADARGLFRVSGVLCRRQEAAKSSVAKLDAMMNYACGPENRMCGLTQYYGAFRTGRWAGRGPQVQNYPRPDPALKGRMEDLIDAIKNGMDARGLENFFGLPAMTLLSSALRACLWVEPPGHFGALDFSQIEARVLAWLSGCEHVLDAYARGDDLYRLAAARIYGVNPGNVTGEQRQVGKVAVLALGYQGGVGAFQTMARNYGLIVDDTEADVIKTNWRAGHPEITSYWYAIQDSALAAVRNPGTTYFVQRGEARVQFSMWKGHLLVGLPSGRHLVYRDAGIQPGTYGDEVTYMGVDQYTRKWTRISTYGGKLVENITQAVARDVMADGMLQIEARGQNLGTEILGSVHDEVLLEIFNAKANLLDARRDRLAGVLKQNPLWAKGLPLDADGYVGRRFGK